MFKLRPLFSRQALDQKLLALNEHSPKTTLTFASSMAGLGYFLLALFPLLTLIGIFKVMGDLGSTSSLGTWIHLLAWIIITAASALITFTQVFVKIAPPSGVGLKEDKAPRLYELLAELGEETKLPRINRLVIHERFSLEFVRVPRFGLPFLTTNVLYIGLPIMQGLSPNQFRGVLAGVLGQYSATQNKKTHWINRCYQFFQHSQRAYGKYPSVIYRPLQWFFNVYTPVLKYCAAGVIRQDELEADIYMMGIFNDREAADVIMRYEVVQAFLKNKYWPKIFAMLRKNPTQPEYLPHVNMAKVLRNGLTENEFAQTMKDLINQETHWQCSKPTLHARLQNIGQRKLNMPPPVMETAAQRYLGDAFGAVIKLLDKQWLTKYSNSAKDKQTEADNSEPVAESEPAKSRSTHKRAHHTTVKETSDPLATDRLPNITSDEGSTITVTERKRLAELKEKADFAELSDNEAWELAYLTEKIEDKSVAITLYQQVLKLNPNHAKTLFAVGRILLSSNNASGVKTLERAMGLDKGSVAQGCWMLAKYFKAHGDDARSKQYLERAAGISNAA